MKPNLFNFGTSELTHDAILSWCLEWGNYKDEILYNLSKDFIELLIGQEVEINKIEILQQKYSIDILAIVNDEFLVSIEDKLDTGAREGQLTRYKKVLEDKYPNHEKFYIYVTVGDEDNYNYILNDGYKVIERRDLLNLIKEYQGSNSILDDYYDYLFGIENNFTNYKENQDLNGWGWRAWQGFFKEKLYPRFKDKNPGWSYVPNVRGGFQAFYWDFQEHKYKKKIPFTSYLQIEADPYDIENSIIAFKVKVVDENYRSEIRNYLWESLAKKIEKNTSIVRPKRFGQGRTMTYAEIKDFNTKAELYNAIRTAEKNHHQFMRYLSSKENFRFDFDEEPPLISKDMILINGKVPDIKIGSPIILITCKVSDKDKLEEFIKKEDGMVFVFQDEASMDHFRRLFFGSMEYLDNNFNRIDLQYGAQSKEGKIKFLRYISGLDNFLDKKNSIMFLNESSYIDILKRMQEMMGEHIWILKDEEDREKIEGFYID